MNIPCEAPYCALNDGHEGEHSHVDGLTEIALEVGRAVLEETR